MPYRFLTEPPNKRCIFTVLGSLVLQYFSSDVSGTGGRRFDRRRAVFKSCLGWGFRSRRANSPFPQPGRSQYLAFLFLHVSFAEAQTPRGCLRVNVDGFLASRAERNSWCCTWAQGQTQRAVYSELVLRFFLIFFFSRLSHWAESTGAVRSQ